jgi:hypothetical protein
MRCRRQTPVVAGALRVRFGFEFFIGHLFKCYGQIKYVKILAKLFI